MEQGQDEFYFALPYDKMDIALLTYNQKEPSTKLAEALGISLDQAEFIYRDIEAKRKTTAMLHWPAIPIETVIGPNTQPPILG
jgi:NAD+ synthase